MAEEISGVRKSAILLLSLPQDQAAEILKRLPPEAVEEVSREIASIGEITVTTRKDIFGEFYSLALANRADSNTPKPS
jgi:flagellar motor switch protein FliG